MSRSAPYQPLLLKIIHGVSGILAIAAIITGFLVYNTFDGRFGKIPLPRIGPIIDIHGTFAVFFLGIFPILAIYSFHAGNRRLLQKDSLQNLTQVGRPIWWVSLQRIANTLMLIASILAVLSGRMMQEEWLPTGDLNQSWYYLHLIAWVLLVCCLAIHVLMSAKVGGAPLLLSIFSPNLRPEDSPTQWYGRLRHWGSNFSANIAGEISNLRQNNFPLSIVEIIVLIGILAALILPLFFSGGD
ncbi:cytochrome b/b6 domain-containing protein [Calothrix sp. FACHB-1219]|uniref:cytochrome b/b6 domain-containing protein n=1 Tax=unclassified Calothrix TaxID=2619626 RepID=UPI0016872DC8|nr:MULTISPECIES: cytochrome b/b6 domain-containing protein [unclassified Calothrix]MBD2207282.1 cytochrome b/b6 domain-containing protein [Calothrix sp. FACHB-168]MBD2216907.1 cytochrome b/b6 domain-containing protein [Calothrix sp. FACHB-1219]